MLEYKSGALRPKDLVQAKMVLCLRDRGIRMALDDGLYGDCRVYTELLYNPEHKAGE